MVCALDNDIHAFGEVSETTVSLGKQSPIGFAHEKMSYDYTAFGEVWAAGTSETVKQRYTYTGREAGVSGAPMYYRYRSYEASLGVFTSRDPAFSPEENLYGYVGGRPYQYDDPYGLVFGYRPPFEIVYGEEQQNFVARSVAVTDFLYGDTLECKCCSDGYYRIFGEIIITYQIRMEHFKSKEWTTPFFSWRDNVVHAAWVDSMQRRAAGELSEDDMTRERIDVTEAHERLHVADMRTAHDSLVAWINGKKAETFYTQLTCKLYLEYYKTLAVQRFNIASTKSQTDRN